jgi:hypothetical protein
MFDNVKRENVMRQDMIFTIRGDGRRKTELEDGRRK